MLMLMLLMFMITLIMTFIMNVLPLINLHKKNDREKMSPFECGFDPFSKPRVSFSIHFFSIMLMFLIFDIEISMILPCPIILLHMKLQLWLVINLTLFLILLIGLILEWKEGSMNWK